MEVSGIAVAKFFVISTDFSHATLSSFGALCTRKLLIKSPSNYIEEHHRQIIIEASNNMIAMKKLKQRSRRTAAAARRPSARGPSILLRRNRQRNNIRSVQFSTTCTAKPFDRKFPAEKLVSGFREEVQLIPIQLLPFVVEEEAQPQEEEEGVQFGDEGGHEPAEPIEQRKRAGGLRREVASLASQLGGYWDVDTSVRRVRKKPDRFMP